MKPKRKRTVREMAAYSAVKYGAIPEDEEYEHYVAAWIYGYRAGLRAGKAKAMRDCGLGA